METQIKSVVVGFPTMQQDPEEISFGEEGENDLSIWEIVESADSDADDVLSLSDSWHSSLSSSPKDSPIPDLIQDSVGDLQHQDYVPFYDGCVDLHHQDYEPYVDDQEEEDDADDYEDEDDGHDLDDELVPRSLSGKFVRQRMRKLGKRAFAKMLTSRKSPIMYVKPGCVHGKHGLGLKHSC